MTRARDIADHGYIYSTPNLLINPQFEVNQRGWSSGGNLVSIGDYAIDRWCAAIANSAPTLSADVLTILSGDAIKQIVEDINIPNGIYTISWNGSAQVSIDGGAAQDSPYTFTVYSSSDVEIEFGEGSLQQPMLVKGSEAKPFQRRDYTTELNLCKRYYQIVRGGFIGYGNASGGYIGADITFPITMRATPSCVGFTNQAVPYGVEPSASAFTTATPLGCTFRCAVSVTAMAVYFRTDFNLDAEL